METQLKQSETDTKTAAPKLRNYVDGALGDAANRHAILDVTNPATGET